MSDPGPVTGPVTVVGAGLAGAACAAALAGAGVPVRVVDRGRAPGGRMCSPEVHGRRVDLGAGYLTAKDDAFAAQVEAWERAGLARPWTDTFGVLDPDADPETKSGPVRWGTPGGLRSLVRSVLDDAGVAVESIEVGDLGELRTTGPVVLAMPDPQAARLVTADDVAGWTPVDYDPVIAVACGYAEGSWPTLHDAAFVNDHPDVEFVADDGARRGDAVPVLVAHTTADRARRHLDDPEAAVGPVVAALGQVLGLPAPAWTHVHRWTFAKPVEAHDAPYLLAEVGGQPLGLAGDQWCPEGAPRVESAWLSGTRLGRALTARVGAGRAGTG